MHTRLRTEQQFISYRNARGVGLANNARSAEVQAEQWRGRRSELESIRARTSFATK